MHRNELGDEPPVPPRRRNRKSTGAASIERAKRPTVPARPKPTQRRLAPPPPSPPPPPLPPPPPPPKAVRRNKLRNRQSRLDDISRENAENNVNQLLNLTNNKKGTNTLHSEDTDLIPTKEVTSDKTRRQDNAKINSCNEHHFHPVFTNPTNTNKYPSLFFTLNDFQNVMANSFTLAGNTAESTRRSEEEDNEICQCVSVDETVYDDIGIRSAVIEEISTDHENFQVENVEDEDSFTSSAIVIENLNSKQVDRILKESDRMESFFSAKSFGNEEDLENSLTDITSGMSSKTDELIRTHQVTNQKNVNNNVTNGRNSLTEKRELETISTFDNKDECIGSNTPTAEKTLKDILDENNSQDAEEKEAPLAKNFWISLKAVQKFTAHLSTSENLKSTSTRQTCKIIDEEGKVNESPLDKNKKEFFENESESKNSKSNTVDYISQESSREKKSLFKEKSFSKEEKEEVSFEIGTNVTCLESPEENSIEIYQEDEGKEKSLFTENSFHTDENEFCFRVTTTNVPFEKCLGRWETSFPSEDFVEEKNSHIFEDYMDRSCRLNVRRSTAVFHCEDFGSLEEIQPARSAPKVRFVIESPSSSTPDDDLEEHVDDSLQNIDSLVIDPVCRNRIVSDAEPSNEECSEANNSLSELDLKEAVANAEEVNNISPDPSTRKDLREALDDLPDSDLTKQFPDDKSADENLIEIDSQPKNDNIEEIRDIRNDSEINSEDDSPNEITDVLFETYSSRPLNVLNSLIYTNVFSLSPCSFDDLPGDLSNANKATGLQSILSDPEENPGLPKTEVYISNPNDASFPSTRGNLSRQKYRDIEPFAGETPNEKKRIPIIESLRELFEDDDTRWTIATVEELNDGDDCDVANNVEDEAEEEEDEDSEMVWDTGVWTQARNPLEKHFSMDLRDSVPVDVRRNSFLETMLSQDLAEEAWHVPTCRIIAFYPKTSTVQLKSLDEEDGAEDVQESGENGKLENFDNSTGCKSPIKYSEDEEKICRIVEDSKDCKSPAKYSRMAEETGKTIAPSSRISDKVLTGKTEVNPTPAGNDLRDLASSPAEEKSPKTCANVMSRESAKAGSSGRLKVTQEARHKNTCEAKSDVLNELLCNFSAIKLKPIENTVHGEKNGPEEKTMLKIDQRISENSEESWDKNDFTKNDRSVSVYSPGGHENPCREEAKERREEGDIEDKSESRNRPDKIAGRTAEEFRDTEKVSENITLACRNWAKTSLSKSSTRCNRKFLDESEIIAHVSTNTNFMSNNASSLDLKFTARSEVESIQGKYPNSKFPTSGEVGSSGRNSQSDWTDLIDKKTDRLSDGVGEVLENNTENARTKRNSFEKASIRSQAYVEKTEETADVVEADNDRAENISILDARTISDAKCAIDRKTPPNHCNNNDNNRAAVDVSTDQSRDTLAIIPGSVRSFVKYYEIRSETTTNHSKSNVSFRNGKSAFHGPTGHSLQNRSFFAHRTSEAFQNAQDVFRKPLEKESEAKKGILKVRPVDNMKTKEQEATSLNGQNLRAVKSNFERSESIRASLKTGNLSSGSILKGSKVVISKTVNLSERSPMTSRMNNSMSEGSVGLPGLIDNEIRYTVIARNVSRKPGNDSSAHVDVRCTWKVDENRTRESERRTSVPEHLAEAVKCERKKSVQFEGGCTVIDSTLFDEDESSAESFPDVKTIRDRWESVGKPMGNAENAQQQTDGIELVNGNVPIECPSNTQRPAVQRPVGREDPKNSRNSGTNSFVPQPETPQLVFYCTV